jgi:serine/threonine protein kinase
LRDRKYEIDVLVVTGHAVTLIDVKGTRGRIVVAGGRWYPPNGQAFQSPVAKLRSHARVLKGRLERYGLSRIYVDAFVLLTAPNARLVDASDRSDADALDVVTGLDNLIPELGKPERVLSGYLRDITEHRNRIIEALTGTVERRTGPRLFGHWKVMEQLGGTDEVTEYRACNADAVASRTVLLRVYHSDPFQPEDLRAAERIAIANAYEILVRLPPDPCVVGCLDFFASEDEGQYVLVLEDVSARALYLHLSNPQLALAADAKLRVIRDMLRGLAHAHANRVIHRALSPTTVLVTGAGGAMLTGFDYARPEEPRSHTVAERLGEVLDPAYVAPECQNRPHQMSKASDVYAAGVVAYQVLTGELPFVSSTDQHERSSRLPSGPLQAAQVPEPLAALLQAMCAQSSATRPSAARALEELEALAASGAPRPGSSGGRRPDYRNLPEGYQLTRKYTVQRRIGSGTFGAVYQVYDNLADADRAVKIVDRDRESPVDRLRQEYRVLLTLPPHPNVVKVESADYLDGEVPYLVFEYLDGQDVSELVRGRVLGPADAVRLGVDAASGLTFLHGKGVFHCDIKPSNLLWTDRGCTIIDFNVAVLASSSMSRAGGSARYAPPDVNRAAPAGAADLADRDVYALGVTLYQVLTGRYPFVSGHPTLGEAAVDPRSINGLGELSDVLVTTLLRAIAPLRSDRYHSAAEFLGALRAIGEVHRRHAPAAKDLPTATSAENVNPFVSHLQTLYSQSVVSNAGTRGEDSYGTYVPTALDEHLIPDVLDGRYRLVVITGNAGDGKTAFLERLVKAAVARGGQPGEPRANGADIRLPDGCWLRTNHDGSQDEGGRANDEVLSAFFGPFADGAEPDPAGTRLIAINEGRLVDFLAAHEGRFGGLARLAKTGLTGQPAAGDIVVVNLNRRSLVADQDKAGGPVFDRVLAELTRERFWAACEKCELARTCYAPHNARTFAHPSAGPKITRRLRELYRLAHLRGQMHITIRDLRSALAFMLTSGRDCTQMHELYRAGDAGDILAGFYFNSWAGTPDTADRLLRLLRELDVAAGAEPVLDRKLAFLGPDADQAVMTVDQRGDYDVALLRSLFAQPGGEPGTDRRYLTSARRRLYFECVDDKRARTMLPYRSAERFLCWLTSPGDLDAKLGELVTAINRGEGLPGPGLADGALAIAIRDVPGGTIRSYRLFPADSLALRLAGASASRYIETEPDGLELSARGSGGHVARLRIRLDLFELLQHQRDGYLPSIAEQQGRYLDLTIFENELSATPYQEVVLTTDSRGAHRIRRERDGRLIMTKAGGGNGS